MSIQTVNPATGDIIQTYTEMSADETARTINASHSTFLEWRTLELKQRATCMLKLSEILKSRKKELALLIAQEMGKPLAQGVSEIDKCAWVCEHFAKNASRYLKQKIIKTEMQKSYVTYQALGVILAIMPWNFPFWQVFRFAAPSLMAGNTAVLKHASISTGSGLAIEQLFVDAGFPSHCFRSLIISDAAVENLIAHPKIVAVMLTGSPRVGKIIGAKAAEHLKKVVLELGGSDPYLILADADLELAAEACVTSRMLNSGQVCIAAKRIIVIDVIKDKFMRLLLEKLKKFTMGNPLEPGVNFGPLARKDIRAQVHEQVQTSIKKGAKLILGGTLPSGNGFYYPPTVLDNVKQGMPAYEDEIFGPVMAIMSAQDEEEAIRLANDTPYGLGAAVFTLNILRGEEIAVQRIEAGTCAVNTYVTSDPRLPFGGIKASGYGRELSLEGILAFVNIKTISIK
jgi:succinate-semialdehyde dehydrogenase/glutarate-semialdehyde dehydrogenase